MSQNEDAEKEATLFAMLLLMPKKFIKEDIENGFDLGDDAAMKSLSKKYQVSITALCVRISYFLKHET